MSQILIHGKLTAKDGFASQLEAAMKKAASLALQAQGCISYIISKDSNDAQSVWITEIWESEMDHKVSLQIPEIRSLIMTVVPILKEMPQKGQTLNILV